MRITCPYCQTNLDAEERYAGKTVQCPKCRQQFTAPPLLSRRKTAEEKTPLIRAATPTFQRPPVEEPPVVKRSNWAAALVVAGIAILAYGGLAAYDLYRSLGENSKGLVAPLIVTTFAAALSCFYAAFITDVLTDIRWFLSESDRRARRDD